MQERSEPSARRARSSQTGSTQGVLNPGVRGEQVAQLPTEAVAVDVARRVLQPVDSIEEVGARTCQRADDVNPTMVRRAARVRVVEEHLVELFARTEAGELEVRVLDLE